MFETIASFAEAWQREMTATRRLLERITQTALDHRPAPGVRSIGEVGWHLVTAIREIGGRTGLRLTGPDKTSAVPRQAADIAESYRRAASQLLDEVRREWNDRTLAVEDDIYGEPWPRGRTLFVLLCHEVHHRGQLTVLFRSAGLPVPAIYGPSGDERAMGSPRP